MEYTFSLEFIYLIASVTYILGLKMLGHPETARRGNLIAAAGMTLAIFGTIFLYQGTVPALIYALIGVSILIGTIIGWIVAKKVDMTKMPELVSLFNGMGGASAALIGLIEFHHYTGDQLSILTIIAAMIIGSISFSGSMIAWAKLNGTMRNPIRLPKYNILNNVFLIAILAFGAYIVLSGNDSQLYVYFILCCASIWNSICNSNWRSRYAGGYLIIKFIYRISCRLWWFLVRKYGDAYRWYISGICGYYINISYV